MGWGALIGASVTDSVIILNTDLAVKAFAGHGQVKFGGNLSVAAGPVGREGDAAAHVGDGGAAACYSYSHSRGLFAGISLQGAIFMTRDSDNARFYGYPVKASEILKGEAAPPQLDDLDKLYEVLNYVNNPEALEGAPLPSFSDASGVSFAGSSYQSSTKFDNDLDDDDVSRRSSMWAQWGQDDDDVAFAQAMNADNAQQDSLPPGWTEVPSETGTYYWHEASGKTQWERPAPVPVVKSAPPPPPPPPMKTDPDALPPGWVSCLIHRLLAHSSLTASLCLAQIAHGRW